VNTILSLNILNDGSYESGKGHRGVRGRVGFANGDEVVRINDIIYIHDPVTNKIIGWYNYRNNLPAKQLYLIDKIIEERARELAFEGKRFFDLMRVAKRRDDPAYLADKVAEKFRGPKREVIRQKLMNPENWYIDYY
jgi:hypothetical protein